jgi:hypothetical protein
MRLSDSTSNRNRWASLTAGVFFFILAALAFAYSTGLPAIILSKNEKPNLKPLYGPTPIDQDATYRISVAWVNLQRCQAELCDIRVRLRAWDVNGGTILVNSSAVVTSWSVGKPDSLSEKERNLGIKPVSMRHPSLENGEIAFLGKDKVALQMGCDDYQGNPVFGQERMLDAHDLHSIFPINVDCGWAALELGLAVSLGGTTKPNFDAGNSKPP